MDQEGDVQSPKINRRRLLQGAGALIAVGAAPKWPAQESAAAGSPSTASCEAIMQKLTSYMGDAGERPLPDHVEEVTKQHILDTIAAMISGVHLPPAQVALRFVRSYGGEKVATVVGSSMKCGPIEAALANAMMAHSDETDDSHAPSQSHPGCGIVPAALAAAENYRISGARFVRAVALGYDIGTRVCMTLGGLPYQFKSHRDTHQMTVNFGSAAAAACAAGLSAQQMRWILDYACQQAAGIAAWNRDTQHVEKSLAFAGLGARNGITAALLIQLGGTGVDNIFFGSDNFFDAFNPDVNPEGLIDKLGERFEVTRTNIKAWSVGSPMQASLDALQRILKAHPFNADQLQEMTVRVDPDEAHIVNNRKMPDICMQYIMAVMVLDKKVTFKSSHDAARMKDPEVLAVWNKIHLIPDEALQALYPARVAIVDVTLKNGEHYSQRVDAVIGSAQNPMNHDQVADKCRDLMAPELGAAQTDKLIDAVFHIEDMPDVRALSPLLMRGEAT
jgi:2-methylcitrate dehydratase PrpD